MALWGGRFIQLPDQYFKKFNNSLCVDYRLVKEDILGSIAWSKSLMMVRVLTSKEQEILEKALMLLLKEVQDNPKKMLNSNSEDVHSWVESELINQVGSLGKKLHTGRSRNDQVSTDLKLWCKSQVNILLNNIHILKAELLRLAEETKNIIMPGYTHLQRAQPITFAHWCLAYIEMLKRDKSRLQDAFKRMDVSPLGSGALSGTSWDIDREKLAHSLGFSAATNNSLDSVSDRDYVIELLSVSAISMLHLSRFSEDLIFFNSGEVNFIELSDSVTSGSSIMPQKKNPDALELIRGKSGRVYGSLIGMLVLLKGLPLAYNKDMQEDKKGLFDGLDTWNSCLYMAVLVLKGIKINQSVCREAAEKGYANATELADYLVSKGIPFRDAHHIVGRIILGAIKKNISLSQIDIETFKKYSSVITSDVYDVLDLQSTLNKRNSKGGVSKEQVSQAIAVLKNK